MNNKNYTKLIQTHLKKIQNNVLKTSEKSNEIYFSMLKKKYNIKKDQDIVQSVNSYNKMFDQKIKKNLGKIPKNCQHIKASFFIWRTIK